MSAFDDFSDGCFADAINIFGTEEFTISSVPSRTFCGVLNEFASEKEIDIAGIAGIYIATLICELGQFTSIAGPLERAFDGASVIIDGKKFKIHRTAIDGISLTLGLQHPNK